MQVADKPKEVPTALPTSTSGTSSAGYGFTLGGLKNLKDISKERMAKQAAHTTNLEFTLETVEQVWKDIQEDLAREKGTSSITFQTVKFMVNDRCIRLMVPLAIFDFIKGKRLFLLDYFKRSFADESINVLIEEQALAADSNLPHQASTREIFEQMAAKNPLLHVLKSKFDLDIEP